MALSYRLDGTPARPEYIDSQALNPSDPFPYGRSLITITASGAVNLANDASETTPFDLWSSSQIQTYSRCSIDTSETPTNLTFPGNFFTPGHFLRWRIIGNINNNIAGTSDLLRFGLYPPQPKDAGYASSFLAIDRSEADQLAGSFIFEVESHFAATGSDPNGRTWHNMTLWYSNVNELVDKCVRTRQGVTVSTDFDFDEILITTPYIKWGSADAGNDLDVYSAYLEIF